MKPDFVYEDWESIDKIAQDEGFFIDDDGNWVPFEEALDYGLEPEELDLDYDADDEDYMSERICTLAAVGFSDRRTVLFSLCLASGCESSAISFPATSGLDLAPG